MPILYRHIIYSYMIYIVVLLAILTIPCPNRVIHAVVNSPSRKATTPRHKAVGYEPRSQHKKPICTYRDMKHLSSIHNLESADATQSLHNKNIYSIISTQSLHSVAATMFNGFHEDCHWVSATPVAKMRQHYSLIRNVESDSARIVEDQL